MSDNIRFIIDANDRSSEALDKVRAKILQLRADLAAVGNTQYGDAIRNSLREAETYLGNVSSAAITTRKNITELANEYRVLGAEQQKLVTASFDPFSRAQSQLGIAALEKTKAAITEEATALRLLPTSLDVSKLINDFQNVERAVISARDSAATFNKLLPQTVGDAAYLDGIRRQEDALKSLQEEQQHQFDAETARMERLAAARRKEASDIITSLKSYQSEQEKASKATFQFAQQVAPSSNIRDQIALQKADFDNETAAMERAAQRQRQAVQQMITDLKLYNREQQIAQQEAFKFAQAIAPKEDITAHLKSITAGSTNATTEVRHLVAIFDEFKRGQFGAMFGTVGAALRDFGLSTGTLAAGIGGLVLFGLAESIQRLSVRMGELYEKTEIGAATVGTSVEQFSRLQNEFEILTGKGQNLSATFGTISQRIEQSLTNPTSNAAGAFYQLGISHDQLKAGLEDLPGFLDILRNKWNDLPQTLQRIELFRAALGRGFEFLVPILNANAAGLAKLDAELAKNKSTFSDHDEVLKRAVNDSRLLSNAFEGLGKEIAKLTNVSSLTSSIRDLVVSFTDAAQGWEMWLQAGKPVDILLKSIRDSLLQINPITRNLKDFGGMLPDPGDTAPFRDHPRLPYSSPRSSFKMGGADYHSASGPSGITFEGGEVGSWLNDPAIQRIAGDTVQKAAMEGFQKFIRSKGTDTSGVKSEALDSPIFDPQALQRELTENLKQLHEATQLREAEFQKEVASADGNRQKIEQIEKQKADFVAGQLQKETAIRSQYSSRVALMAGPGQEQQAQDYARQFNDSANVQRQVVATQTQSIQAQNALRREQVQSQINQLKAQMDLSRNDQEREGFANKIAQLEATLNDKSQGAVIIAEQEARAIQHKIELKNEEVATQSRVNSELLRGFEAQQQILVDRKQITPIQAFSNDLSMLEQLSAAQKKRLDNEMELANELKDETLQTQVYWKEWQEGIQKQEKSLELHKQIATEIKRENQQMLEPLTQGIAGIDNAFKSFFDAAITKSQTFKQAMSSLLTSIIKEVGNTGVGILGNLFTKAIGGAVGESFSQFASRKIGDLFGLTTKIPEAVGSTTAITAAMATGGTTAGTAIATAMTTAGATAGSEIAAAMSAAGAGSAAAGGAARGIFGLGTLLFARGGIVPSAAGGMVAGSGTLALLHPQEMVLPAHLSTGLQNMIQQSGGNTSNSANLTYNANVTGYHPYGSKSSFQNMLRNHGDALMGHLANMARNNFQFA